MTMQVTIRDGTRTDQREREEGGWRMEEECGIRPGIGQE
jgi:hypothetical protein